MKTVCYCEWYTHMHTQTKQVRGIINENIHTPLAFWRGSNAKAFGSPSAYALMTRHTLGTSSNRYAADKNRQLQIMRSVSQRYFSWLLEDEESSQVQTQKRQRSNGHPEWCVLKRKLPTQPRTKFAATINTNNRRTAAACNIRKPRISIMMYQWSQKHVSVAWVAARGLD